MDTRIKEAVKGHDLLKLIGNTPVVDVFKDKYPHSDIKLKLESYNPGGSIKDRVAYQIIMDAEIKGLISMGDELVEATSGNTGIGIAWIGKLKGYKVTIITSDKISNEKLALLKFYGANVIIMPSDASLESNDTLCKRCETLCGRKRPLFLRSVL
ncbi:pyridoxal-phosphate dependent enzyme [Enterobacteriaceae bacterium H4N4]|uniref:Cysteine synthase B n=1 Tax=Silvania confinis TaxID=2926470 RepID=A0A9J6QEA1_9ENTR|nr:pyridoxal-phosphate dependent enzyme [Silvania confinis]MCU6667686.1 pyridoxal-phosphate dependent enzyme [Silvania confinis]